MKDIFLVEISKPVEKYLKQVPLNIRIKFLAWVEGVLQQGLFEMRKIPGYHDEPLKGKRFGQRSIRLSKSYRAIYEVINNKQIEFVEVQEISKHEY